MYDKKLFRVVVASLVVLIIMMSSIFIIFQLQYRSINYTNIDMADVADGIYRGKADTLLLKVEVDVEVEDHKIKNIEFIEHVTTYEEVGEHIVNKIIEENSYQIDVVTSATASTKVITSAVNKALESAVE